MKIHFFLIPTVTAVALASGTGLEAQTRNFDGGGNGSSWADSANWSDDNTPDSVGESASIDGGGAWDVVSSGVDFTLDSLTIGSDDSLTINNSIEVGTIDMLLGEVAVSSGGFLTINSSWQNDGTITINDFGFFIMPNSSQTLTNGTSGLIRGQAFQSALSFIPSNVLNNGTIAPGFGDEDTAVLSITGDVVMGSSSVLDLEIGGGTTNFSFDSITGMGSAQLGGELQLTMFNGYTPLPSATLTIVQTSVSNGVSGAFSNVADGERLTTTDGAGSWLVDYQGGSVVITDYQPIPEPSAAMFFLFAAAVGLFQRRRR